MRTIIIHKKQADYSREVRTYLYNYQRFIGKPIEELDPDSKNGAILCKLYGIVQYPSIIVISSSGILQNSWQGLPLPLMDEVSYYN